MGRPPTGSYRERNGRLLVSVPASQGSKKRVELSFALDDRPGAEAWVQSQLALIAAGKNAVKPAADRPSGVVTTRPAVVSGDVISFVELAELWIEERYSHLQTAGAGRVADIRRNLQKHIIPAFDDIFSLKPLAARQLVIDWVRTMAGEEPIQPSSPFSPAKRTHKKEPMSGMLWVVHEVIDYGVMLDLCPAIPLAKVSAIAQPRSENLPERFG